MDTGSPKITIRLPVDMLAALKSRLKSGEKISDHIRAVLARSLKVAIPDMPRGHGSAENPQESAREAAEKRWEKSRESD